MTWPIFSFSSISWHWSSSSIKSGNPASQNLTRTCLYYVVISKAVDGLAMHGVRTSLDRCHGSVLFISEISRLRGLDIVLPYEWVNYVSNNYLSDHDLSIWPYENTPESKFIHFQSHKLFQNYHLQNSARSLRAYTVETPYSTIPYTTIFDITRWAHGPQNLQRPIRTLIVLLGFRIKQIFL